jgi:hypothetical protein
MRRESRIGSIVEDAVVEDAVVVPLVARPPELRLLAGRWN